MPSILKKPRTLFRGAASALSLPCVQDATGTAAAYAELTSSERYELTAALVEYRQGVTRMVDARLRALGIMAIVEVPK